jgi:tight adherence protein B
MSVEVLGLAAAVLAGVGAYLIYTAVVFDWPGRGPGVGRRLEASVGDPRHTAWSPRRTPGLWGWEMMATSAVVALAGAAAGFVLFGGWLPPLVAGGCVGVAPISAHRSRQRARRRAAAEAWPALLEELRLRTGSLGRPVPQALFEVGRRAPTDWRPAFVAAEREWLLTTDFARTIAVLKDSLADPTVDAVSETLLVANEVGGTDLDAKLADLIEDRTLDLQGRKDAASRQAGVRFARLFVLLVPLGMALAGMTIGTGRRAYETSGGQIAVVVGLLAVLGCWVWAGRLMRIPDEPRVFG